MHWLRSQASVARRVFHSRLLKFPHCYTLTIRRAEALWQLNATRQNALVTILRNHASLRAFSKDCEIFLGHIQPMLSQFRYVIFLLIHHLGAGNVVRQMSEQVSQHFGTQELMNPNLEPGFTLEVNVAEGVLNFARVKGKFGVIQCHSASAKQKTTHF